VTGLVLARDTVGIGRHRLRELRARIHHAHTGRPVNIQSIQGWLDYVWDVDRERYRILARYVEKLRAGHDGSELAELRIQRAFE
jgi:RNA-directed DNA polymerase